MRHHMPIGALALMLLVAACTAAPAPPPPATPEPPIELRVAVVELEDRRQRLPEANFVDEARSNLLAGELRRSLEERLHASGGGGSAKAIIERASLTERLIGARRGGVLGIVTGEPTFDMQGQIAVRVVILDPAGVETAFATASIARSRQIRAGASVIERDAESRALVRELVTQLGPALEQAIRENLAAFAGS